MRKSILIKNLWQETPQVFERNAARISKQSFNHVLKVYNYNPNSLPLVAKSIQMTLLNRYRNISARKKKEHEPMTSEVLMSGLPSTLHACLGKNKF